jgi:phosphoserine phosphatase
VRSAAFFRLEGALSAEPAWTGARWLASNAPSVRRRIFGVAGVALSAALGRRDPAITREVAWSVLRGFSEDRLLVLGEDYARDHLLPGIKPDARRLLEEARAGGHVLVLVSESIDVIARPVGEALGIDVLVSNTLDMEAREATGTLRAPIVGSAIDPRRLRELAARERIDLARSSAYGAQGSDGILLSLVGLPCAVDPDRDLARVARELDWPVVRSAPAAEGGAR